MRKLAHFFSEIVFISFFVLISVILFSLLFLNIEWIAGGIIVSTSLFLISLLGAYFSFNRLIRLVNTFRDA